MSRKLIISEDQIVSLANTTKSKKKSVSLRLAEFKEALDTRRLEYTSVGTGLTFKIPEVMMAGRDNMHWGTANYEYLFKGFKCEVGLNRPVFCKPTADPGKLFSGSFKVDGKDEQVVPALEYIHPHFSTRAMCLAMGWQDEFEKCIKADNWQGLVDCVIASIAQYNRGNPYRHMPHENPDNWLSSYEQNGTISRQSDYYEWDDDDGDDDNDDDYSYCPHCDIRTHYEDTYMCESCDNYICNDCSRSCAHCNEICCPNCSTTHDNVDYCTECFNENIDPQNCDSCDRSVIRDMRTLCTCWNEVCDTCIQTCDVCEDDYCPSCMTAGTCRYCIERENSNEQE